MSGLSKLQNTQISNKTAAGIIAIFLVVVSIGVWAIKNKVTAPTVQAREPLAKPASQNTNSTKPAAIVLPQAGETKPAPTTEKAPDEVEIIGQRDIFKPLVRSTTASAPPSTTTVPPMPVGMLPVLPGGAFGPPGRGRAGSAQTGPRVAYTGIVQTPEGIMALLEDTVSHESRYVSVGDTAFGMSVTEVSPKYVSLSAMGTTLRLAMGENKPDAQPAATPAAPGTPGTPQAPGTPGAPGTPSVGTPGRTPGSPGFTPGQSGGFQMAPSSGGRTRQPSSSSARDRWNRRRE